MKVTTKGRVTIPQPIRAKLGIAPHSEVDFVEEGDKVYLLKKADAPVKGGFRSVRGITTLGLSTDEIMALTRGEG